MDTRAKKMKSVTVFFIIVLILLMNLLPPVTGCSRFLILNNNNSSDSNSNSDTNDNSNSNSSPGTVGTAAPDFTLNDFDGNSVTLSSFKTNKTVLIDFWATWCGPCVTSMPHTQELHEKFKNRGLEVLAVNIEGNRANVSNFMANNNYTFTVLLDSGNWSATTIDLYNVNSIPRAIIIDKGGIIQYNGHPTYISTNMIVSNL